MFALIKLVFALQGRRGIFSTSAMVLFAIFLAALETLALALLIPIVNFARGSSLEFTGFAGFKNTVNITNDPAVLILAMLSCLALASLGRIVWLRWLLTYTSHFETQLGSLILNQWLKQPYEKIAGTDFNRLVNSVVNESAVLVRNGLLPLLQMFSAFVLLATMWILLISVDKSLTLAITILFAASWIIIKLSLSKALQRFGNERLNSSRNRLKILRDAIGRIKYALIMGETESISRTFKKASEVYRVSQARADFAGAAPRYLVEAVVFISGLILVMAAMVNLFDWESHISFFIIFLASFLKLLPSAVQIHKSTSKIRFTKPVITDFLNQLAITFTQKNEVNRIECDNNLSAIGIIFENVTFKYAENNLPILKNFSMRINPNSFVAIWGVSGSGKSTITDLMLGLLEPTSGRIFWNSKTDEMREVCLRNLGGVGYVPQDIQLMPTSIKQNIIGLNNPSSIDLLRLELALEISGLRELFLTRSDLCLDTVLLEGTTDLSGGQKKRVGIARGIYHAKRLLVLDEPTTGLESQSSYDILLRIKSLASYLTIILISHNPKDLVHCSEVIRLEDDRHP